MLKKLFRSLTKSQAEIYLEDLEAFASALQDQRATEVMRAFIAMKRDIEQRLESNEAVILEVDDLSSLTTAVCDAVKKKLKTLSELANELAPAITSGDASQYLAHMDQWKQGYADLMHAYAALRRTISESTNDKLERDLPPSLVNSPLKEAVDSLMLEVRTAERIRDEL